MAIFTPSSIISEIRGNVGSVNYSRNRSGPIIRAAINQTNPDTSYQAAVRAAFDQAVEDWQAIPEALFDRYQAYVTQHVQLGRIGRKMKRSAYNEFMSRQMNRFLIDGVTVNVDPWPEVRNHPWIESVEIGEDQFDVNVTSLEGTSSTKFVVYASALKSQGIRSLTPAWCSFITEATVATADHEFDIYSEYIARFPYIGDPNGARIFVGVKAINTDNYAASKIMYGSQIVSGWPVIMDTFDDTFDDTFL